MTDYLLKHILFLFCFKLFLGKQNVLYIYIILCIFHLYAMYLICLTLKINNYTKKKQGRIMGLTPTLQQYVS
jgi:hypothetical protein